LALLSQDSFSIHFQNERHSAVIVFLGQCLLEDYAIELTINGQTHNERRIEASFDEIGRAELKPIIVGE
jgi:hypothetical protein